MPVVMVRIEKVYLGAGRYPRVTVSGRDERQVRQAGGNVDSISMSLDDDVIDSANLGFLQGTHGTSALRT